MYIDLSRNYIYYKHIIVVVQEHEHDPPVQVHGFLMVWSVWKTALPASSLPSLMVTLDLENLVSESSYL